MVDEDPLLDEILGFIPRNLRDVPGSTLYSGRDAWTGNSSVYLMGLNPGGDPAIELETVAAHTQKVLQAKPANFSEYRDGRWGHPGGGKRPPGTAPVQRRVLHLFTVLGLDPGSVPGSNLVFARSRRWGDHSREQQKAWADACWPFHQAMIERLGVRVMVCFGQDAADLACAEVGAHAEVDRFVEANSRGWTSRTFRGDGLRVVQVTHPSVADWCNPVSDPSPLVVNALAAGH